MKHSNRRRRLRPRGSRLSFWTPSNPETWYSFHTLPNTPPKDPASFPDPTTPKPTSVLSTSSDLVSPGTPPPVATVLGMSLCGGLCGRIKKTWRIKTKKFGPAVGFASGFFRTQRGTRASSGRRAMGSRLLEGTTGSTCGARFASRAARLTELLDKGEPDIFGRIDFHF